MKFAFLVHIHKGIHSHFKFHIIFDIQITVISHYILAYGRDGCNRAISWLNAKR